MIKNHAMLDISPVGDIILKVNKNNKTRRRRLGNAIDEYYADHFFIKRDETNNNSVRYKLWMQWIDLRIYLEDLLAEQKTLQGKCI